MSTFFLSELEKQFLRHNLSIQIYFPYNDVSLQLNIWLAPFLLFSSPITILKCIDESTNDFSHVIVVCHHMLWYVEMYITVSVYLRFRIGCVSCQCFALPLLPRPKQSSLRKAQIPVPNGRNGEKGVMPYSFMFTYNQSDIASLDR